MDYDSAQSIVVTDTSGTSLEDGLQLACCELVPPFPNFPDEWWVDCIEPTTVSVNFFETVQCESPFSTCRTATIEINIVNKGYTFVQREYYSKSAVRLREMGFG